MLELLQALSFIDFLKNLTYLSNDVKVEIIEGPVGISFTDGVYSIFSSTKNPATTCDHIITLLAKDSTMVPSDSYPMRPLLKILEMVRTRQESFDSGGLSADYILRRYRLLGPGHLSILLFL